MTPEAANMPTRTDRMQKSGAPWRRSFVSTLMQSKMKRAAYCTVIVPFMFMARCGVQWNGYTPGFTPAKEIV